MRSERAWAIVASCAAAAAFAGEWRGLSPAVLTLVALAAWLPLAVRRIGAALGVAAVVVAWMSVVLAVLTLTPALGVDPAIAIGVVLVALTLATIPAVAAIPPAPGGGVLAPMAACLTGPALWAAGLVWGNLASSGGGMSWAAYNDSTGAVWTVRGVIQYGGVASIVHSRNAVPLSDAVTASFLPPGMVADASPTSVAGQLSAHALSWAVVIALASLVYGLVVVSLGSRTETPRWPALTGAALVSTLLLAAPITGRILDLGQINAHLIILLVGASVLAGLGAGRHRLLALSVLLGALGLLVICWTPFAIVPALIVVPVARQARRERPDRQRLLSWLLPGGAVAGWTVAVYGRRLLLGFVTTNPDHNRATVETYSRPGYWEPIGNPYWWPLSIALLVATIALTFALRRRHREPALVAGWASAGLALGMVPFLLLLRRLPNNLEYYPAKYLSLATICLAPLAVGAALRTFGTASPRRTSFAAASLLAVAALALAAPPPANTPRWGFTPLMIARGEHYGTGAQVADRIVDFTSNDALVLPWRYDPPFDTAVALMDSSIGPAIDSVDLSRRRGLLRNYRNDFSATVACQLAAASTIPVVLVTRDPTLRGEVESACPDAAVTVRYEPSPSR